MQKKIYFAAVLLGLVGGCSENNSTGVQDKPENQVATNSQAGAESVNEDKTKAVLDHHWEAFMRNDMEAVMADYTEESVLIKPEETLKGLEEIRKNFEGAFVKFPKDKTSFKLNKSVVIGDVGYILWQAKAPAVDLTFATDSFVIRNGKIVSQTFAGVAQAPK